MILGVLVSLALHFAFGMNFLLLLLSWMFAILIGVGFICVIANWNK